MLTLAALVAVVALIHHLREQEIRARVLANLRR